MSTHVKILTPQHSLPYRFFPDGNLFYEAVKDFINVVVLEDVYAISLIHKRQIGLILMDAQVIGQRQNEELEIVSSHKAASYVESATKVYIPVGVITSVYNFWSSSTYERCRPRILDDINNIIIGSKSIQWIITDVGILYSKELEDNYATLFETVYAPEILKANRSKSGNNLAFEHPEKDLAFINRSAPAEVVHSFEEPSETSSIFLCHASEDKQKVREVYRRLKEEGFQPWLDEEDLLPGQLWRQEIPKVLRSSDFIRVVPQ